MVADELEQVAVEERWCRDLVAALTDAPEWKPFCAFCALVSTRNSCSASGNGSGRLKLSYGLL